MPQKPTTRPGLPEQDVIVGVKSLVHVAELQQAVAGVEAGGAPPRISKYRILITNEVDGYEKAATADGLLNTAFAATAAVPTGDNYKGTDRKAAKLSIAKADIEEFDDLKDLIESLPLIEEMVKHKPKIGTDSASDRVKEEKRNIRIRAFLYAASRENDNDFHLIIGRDPDTVKADGNEVYMTMEISGLPPKKSDSFDTLKSARNAYKAFFGANLPGFGYEYPDPPVPVEIEGSLFFDMTHAHGTRPGPKSLRKHMPTIWEVHPVTRIVFEPS